MSTNAGLAALGDEEIHSNLVKEFARIAGVGNDEVKAEPSDNGQSFTLSAHAELQNEARDYELVITAGEKNTFSLTGSVKVITAKGQPQSKPINKKITCPPQYLPRAMARELNDVKSRRKGWLKGYF